MSGLRTILYLIALLSTASFAAGEIEGAFYSVCGVALFILLIAVLLVSVLAAMIYAVGQMMGAETRARATVWATNLFTGALISAIIFLLVPYVLETLGIGAITDIKTQCMEAAGGSDTGTRVCVPSCSSPYVCQSGTCVISVRCGSSGMSCGSRSLPCCSGLTCVSGTCSRDTICGTSGSRCLTRSDPPCCSNLRCIDGACRPYG